MSKRIWQVRKWLIDKFIQIIGRWETPVANPADIYYSYKLILGRDPDDEGW